MLDIIFVCMLGNVKKEIKIEKDKSCKVFISDLSVGEAKTNVEFCVTLADKVKGDLERKGYKCETKKI